MVEKNMEKTMSKQTATALWKYTAQAPANIAFVKYWGKANEELRLPLNSSLSMNLSNAHTTTTVEFSKMLSKDSIKLIDGSFSSKEKGRIAHHLNRIRTKTSVSGFAHVVTQNNFPKGSGIASSASGFAALTLAATAAAGLQLSEKELSILARLGSGSASRSIPDGFVVWEKGTSTTDSYAHSIYSKNHWDLRDVLAIVSSSMKHTDSRHGMRNIRTSPLWESRVKSVSNTMREMKRALREKNFQQFGELLEADCLSMHAVMQSQIPALNYWTDETHAVMEEVVRWRADGLPVYATIDAGPNVHLICEGKNEKTLVQQVKKLPGVKKIISNKPAKGAHLVKSHLF